MKFHKLFTTLFTLFCLFGIIGVITLALVIQNYSKGLPDYMQLTHYNPPTVTRLYAADGKMIAEYANEKRLYVPIEAIPKRLINAFIAAEDKNFYTHPGIDLSSIIRAAFANALNYKKNRSLAGGSTITQQVVKNFLLTKEKSIERKIREAILAFRITKAFSKDRIMELYLNQIYLGNRSYGVAAAAQYYFNKSIGELSIEEAALLAAMPKAPSSLDPKRYPDHALERRNWVISRMEEEGYISQVESVLAMSKPITLKETPKLELVNAGFFTDAVKQQLIDIYGEEAVMQNGFAVRTTLDPAQQKYAEDALMGGIRAYDHRHGWRGPIKHFPSSDPEWVKHFKDMPLTKDLGIWNLALVTHLTPTQAILLLKDGTQGAIPLDHMDWARKFITRNTVGHAVKQPSDALKIGDVIAVSLDTEAKNKTALHIPIYTLEQIPQINGAIVALDPHTGRVHAMVGGYYYGDSQFNRATQAQRQPGSSFKPFVYLTALENNFRPNSIVVDEPIYLNQGANQKLWSPQNHTHEYYGPTTLRVAVEQSRNVVTVRLSQMLGIDRISNTVKRFNINENPPRNFAMVLGAAETTLLKLTTAYGMVVNGGKKISPSLIERIQNRKGQTIYKRDQRVCNHCLFSADENDELNAENPPILIDNRKQIADPIASYQTVSFLQGVVQRGTGRRALALNRTIGGKTGTTNESFDTWFIGFTPDLVVGVFMGFDEPASLGHHEYGSSIALPIWINFMANALQNNPDVPFRRPDGVKLVKVNLNNGLLPSAGTSAKDIIFEAFKAGTEPKIGGATPNNRPPWLSPSTVKGEPDLGDVY